MSIPLLYYAGLQLPTKGLPRWQYIRTTPAYVNEGDNVTWTLKGTNLVVGSRCIIWFTDPLMAGGNWNYSWESRIREAAAKVGFSVTKLTLSSVPKAVGTLDLMFTALDTYVPGGIMTVTNSVKKNRQDNQGSLPDGTKGRNGQILTKAIPANEGGVATVDGAFQPGTGSFIYARDTSRKPTGYPTISIRSYAADNVSPPVQALKEGDEFIIRVNTINPAPGTKLKMYAANTGQYDVSPAFRNEIRRAALASACKIFIPNWTPETALKWYNGGEITFTEEYRDSNPITMRFKATIDDEDEPTEDFNILSSITREGDLDEYATYSGRGNWTADTLYKIGEFVFYVPTGRYFVYTSSASTSGNEPPTDDATYSNSFWREFLPVAFDGSAISKTFQDIPARYWELRATTDGTTISYRIQGPANLIGDTVELSSINPPPGFEAALIAACGDGSIMSYSAGVLTSYNTDRLGGAISFTVPHAGNGKHALRLSNPQLAYLVIEEACVFLTSPVIPFWPANVYGMNAAGAEFGSVYVPVYPPADAAKWGNAPFGSKTLYNVYGSYYYPSKPENGLTAHQILDYIYDMGCRHIRFPVRWERLQPNLFGPLYYGPEGPFTARSDQEIPRMLEAVNYWVNIKKCWVSVDIHNYNEYTFPPVFDEETGLPRTQTATVGFKNDLLPPAAHIDLCVKIADVLTPYQHGCALDCMNEPKERGAIKARDIANQHQAVVNAVRARTNFLGRIYTEAGEYTSAWNFVSNGNSDAYSDFYDPANNHCIEVHLYNNSDASGAGADQYVCVSGSGKGRIGSITTWARTNGRRLRLGETAGGDPSIAGRELCGAILPELYQFLIDNADVWEGYDVWGGGFPASYGFGLMPANGNYTNPIYPSSAIIAMPFWKDRATVTPASG
jgi:hypothetical protein